MRGPQDMEVKPAANNMCVSLVRSRSRSPGKPSEAAAPAVLLMATQRPWARTTQPNHFLIANLQKPCNPVNAHCLRLLSLAMFCCYTAIEN